MKIEKAELSVVNSNSVIIRYKDKITGKIHIAVGFLDKETGKVKSVFRP